MERGLPADLVTAESNVWKRLTLTHNRWPDIAEFIADVAAVEIRRAEKAAQLAALHDREISEPAAHADQLATWQLGGEQGPRPESELQAIRDQIQRRQEEQDALDRAITRVLDKQVAHWEKHRPRLIRDADKHRDEAVAEYLENVAKTERSRAKAYQAQRLTVTARLYPSHEATHEVPDTLAGGLKRPLQAMGLSQRAAPDKVFTALRADAEWLADAMTPEQRLAIQGGDPKHPQPPNTEWHNDPAVQAKRDKKTAEWLARR